MNVYDTSERQAVAAVTVDQDSLRALQLFQAFRNLTGDQTYVSTDSIPSGPNGAFVIANPDGTASVVGRPISNIQGAASVAGLLSNPLVLIGLVVLGIKLLR